MKNIKKPQHEHRKSSKPSSSGRSALLLPAGNTSSLLTMKPDPASVDTSGRLLSVEIDSNLDPNLQVVFKRMYKKDVTTRHKALREFAELCKTYSDDLMQSLLPTWTKIYSKLSLDVEHRIREATQQAHLAVVSRVRRNLAPYIKQIMPFWFISQYDTHPPAASAAVLAYKEAFPPHKIVNAIVFCQEEILTYIYENLITYQPPNVTKTDKLGEELAAKFERTLVSCINGYALYLSKIPLENLNAVMELNEKIIKSPNFWKFCNYKGATVRAAWYSLLSTICQNTPQLLENDYSRAINAVFLHLEDYDPVVLPYVWEATLHIVSNYHDCWKHVSLEKVVIPKICRILSNAGQGNASLIFPNILPLLSKIPQTMISNETIFYEKIFNSFQTGFKQPSVIQSRIESAAVASSYIECLKYTLMIHADDIVLCSFLIENLLSTVSQTMMLPDHKYFVTALYSELPQTLIYCEKQGAHNYKKILDIFWTQLELISVKNIDECISDIEKLTYLYDSQKKLIEDFNKPKLKKKKKLKVQFASDEPHEPKHKIETISSDDWTLSSNVMKVARALCSKYFDVENTYNSIEVKKLTIKQLWEISNVLDKKQISELVKSTGKDFTAIIIDWLLDESIDVKFLVGIVFNTIDFLEENNQNLILEQFLKVRPFETILEAIRSSMEGLSNKPSLENWLQSEPVRLETCKILKTRDENSTAILKNCLTVNSKGNYLMGIETVTLILDTLIEELEKDLIQLSVANAVLSPLFSMKNSYQLEKHSEQILKLARLLFVKIANRNDSGTTGIWENGVRVLCSLYEKDDPKLTQFVAFCAGFVSEYINKADVKLDMNHLVRTCIMLHKTISQAYDDDDDDASNVCTSLLSVIIKDASKYEPDLESLCTDTKTIDGSISYYDIKKYQFEIENEHWNPLNNINCYNYSQSLVFCVKYLMVLMDAEPNEDVDSEDELAPEHIGTTHFKTGQYNELLEFLLHLCYGYELCETTITNFIKQCYLTFLNLKIILPALKEIVQRLNQEQQASLISLAYDKPQTTGLLWDDTIQLINSEFLDTPTIKNMPEIDKVEFSVEAFNYARKQPDEKHSRNMLDFLITNYKQQTFQAFDRSLSELSPEDLRLTSEISWFLTKLIRFQPHIIHENEKAWDFVMIAIASWLNSLHLTQNSPYFKEFVRLTCSVCDLYCSFIKHLASDPDSKTSQEWKDVFSTDTFMFLIEIWKNLSEKTLENTLCPISILQVNKLCDSLHNICQSIYSNTENAEQTKYLFQIGIDLIGSPYIPVQLASYHIISSLVPVLVKQDSGCDERKLDQLSCHYLMQKFIDTNEVVTTLLRDYGMSVSCCVSPYTDSYTYALSYLLMWSFLLKLCKEGDSQTKYTYTLWIKEQNLVKHFMESIVRLMPESVLNLYNISKNKRQELFIDPPNLSFDMWTSERLSQFSCWVYCDMLRSLPAVLRQWVAEADPKFFSFVDKLTTCYVSPIICAEEMQAVKTQQKAFENMKVQTFPAAREVVASYMIEDTSMELVIKLTLNHPLSPPKVEIPKGGVNSSNLNRFFMLLTIFLSHQNGSIWDGLLLWKNNLDKKFDGVEECYICFSIFHSASQQLPKLTCQTCKKKFHTYCLYKWFTTSNKSTCPICRNHF